jgi:hypothetical protein
MMWGKGPGRVVATASMSGRGEGDGGEGGRSRIEAPGAELLNNYGN